MKRRLIALASVAAMLMLVVGLQAAEKAPGKKKGAKAASLKCPVSGKPVNPEAKIAYKGGTLLLCCEGCPKAIKSKPEKYAAKANKQLVATKQAKQVGCPISGRKLNPETVIKVDGVPVCFCCANCQAKAKKASGDDQTELLFGEKAFGKGFKVGAKKSSKKQK